MLALLMCACQANDTRHKVVETLSMACGAVETEQARILDRFTLASARHAPKSEITPTPSKTPLFDHENYWLLRVDMGCQPNAGYALRLISDKLEINGTRASLALAWEKPDPERDQIQITACPCLHLRIAKGEYDWLEIADQDGSVRFELKLR